MALYATNRFAGDGTTTQYEINFVGQYIDRSHVKAYRVDDATQVRTPVTIAPGQWLNATTITGFAPTPVGQTLVIYRDTPKPPLVDFVNGSRFTEYNMDLVARQGLFVAMEALDSNDHEAIDELLAAISTVVGLVDQATIAASDATASALAAAGSAADALGHANAAQAARTAAETARNAAQASAGNAATSATNAGNSATAAASSASAAGTSATNAANSATTASTQAGLAGGYAVSANTQATNAATSAAAAGNSATAAAGSASAAATSAADAATYANNASNSEIAAAGYANTLSIQGRMACRVVVADVATRTLRLERCGGQTMVINGVARVIPAAGVSLSVASSSTPKYLYATWSGSAITLSESTAVPTFNTTLGQWAASGNANSIPVAYFRGDGLATPERMLRNYYNGNVMAMYSQGRTPDLTAAWDGVARQLVSLPILLLPGDTIDLQGIASIMSEQSDRVGDLTVRLGSTILATARNTHAGALYAWMNYSCRATLQRGAGTADPAQQDIFELWYYPISTTGSTWLALGDGTATKLIVNIAPYRWA